MRRATTPTHTFCFPTEYQGKISKVLVTYSQNGVIVLQKKLDDGVFENNIFKITLTQEETNLFNNFQVVEIQVRALTQDNSAVASDIYEVPCQRVLNDEVL